MQRGHACALIRRQTMQQCRRGTGARKEQWRKGEKRAVCGSRRNCACVSFCVVDLVPGVEGALLRRTVALREVRPTKLC